MWTTNYFCLYKMRQCNQASGSQPFFFRSKKFKNNGKNSKNAVISVTKHWKYFSNLIKCFNLILVKVENHWIKQIRKKFNLSFFFVPFQFKFVSWAERPHHWPEHEIRLEIKRFGCGNLLLIHCNYVIWQEFLRNFS